MLSNMYIHLYYHFLSANVGVHIVISSPPMSRLRDNRRFKVPAISVDFAVRWYLFGATVCCTHQSLYPNCTFHCDRNMQILVAYIIKLITLSSGDLVNSSNKSELLSVYTMQFESTLNFDYNDKTVTLKS